jgi:hypothetical protein
MISRYFDGGMIFIAIWGASENFCQFELVIRSSENPKGFPKKSMFFQKSKIFQSFPNI